MKIYEAVEKALKEKKPITRMGLRDFGFSIFPTDSSDCCYLIPKDEKQQPARCWNPTANDLLADDWELVTKNMEVMLNIRLNYISIQMADL